MSKKQLSVYKIKYQLGWMKECISNDYFKIEFIHASNKEDAANKFGISLMEQEEGFVYEILESNLVEEIQNILYKELSCDTFTESVEGIDAVLAENLISVVREITNKNNPAIVVKVEDGVVPFIWNGSAMQEFLKDFAGKKVKLTIEEYKE